MGKFTAHNLGVIGKKFGKIPTSKSFTDEMARSLSGIADWVMRGVYDNIPVDTFNLLEGTGIGIYTNGVLTEFRYDEMATQPRDGEWGRNTLTKALTAGASRFSTGIWIVAFSTMPYAQKVDDKGGFFSQDFVESLEDLVLAEFKLK